MQETVFETFKNFLYKNSGLVITPEKTYLLESRLSPVLREHNIPDLAFLARTLSSTPHGRVHNDVIEAMTTNETMFFRDIKPFEKFKDIVMPAILAAKGNNTRIRIWSAACSSGQEPYTLAIQIKENAHLWPGVNFEILATDISDKILDKAKKGHYSQFEVQRGMPTPLLVKHFTQTPDGWQIKDDIKNMVSYKNVNLLDNLKPLGSFDIIFCRNVLIYFDQPTKTDVLAKLHAQIAPHGFLFLGGAETVLGLTTAFKPMPDERGLYIPETPSVQNQSLPQPSAG